jgi:hypothetical protein
MTGCKILIDLALVGAQIGADRRRNGIDATVERE